MHERLLWAGIMLLVLVAMVISIMYLIRKIRSFKFVKALAKGKNWLEKLISGGVILVGFIICSIFLNYVNAVLVMLHIIVFWLLADLVCMLLKKYTKLKIKQMYSGIMAVCVTVVYLSVGFYLDYNVWEKHYALETEKNVGELRILQFADSHIGATFDGEGLGKHVDRMNATNPDIVVITGDFVDDGTNRDNMIKACESVGKLKAKYGVYYAFGNHDKGYYNNEARGYNSDDLISELKKNGVIVLQDEAVLVDNRFYVVGRQDRSEESRSDEGRRSMDELVSNLDTSKYIIVLDHQPHDYKAEAKAEVDLVLSGHTHGGQLFPINYVGEWTGENDKTYGHERRGTTDFIVTSGISDWEIKFKTGCKSEYVVIDVKNK